MSSADIADTAGDFHAPFASADGGTFDVLWASDNVALDSAYATQTRKTLAWLADDEWEPAAGLDAGHAPLIGLDQVEYEAGDPWPFRVWPAEQPAHKRQFGGDLVLEAFYRGEYDLLVALKDALQWLPRFHDAPVPTVMYTPVPSDPAPPALFESLETATAIWCPSRNGVEQLEARGLAAEYVPHHVDAAAFRPVRDDDPVGEADLRAAAGEGTAPLRPDDYVVGFCGLNRGERKDLGRIVEGFARWRREYDHPDARLHLHTTAEPMGDGGVHVDELRGQLGLPEPAVLVTDPWRYRTGYSTVEMATWYATLDCYLGATRGEGFGVPLLEAAACGVPIVATDHAAMAERVADGNGVLVEPVEREVNRNTGVAAIPAVADIAAALEDVYRQSWDPEAVRATVVPEFDVEQVLHDYLLPALADARDAVYATEVVG